jgi:protoheme IX farnesyltransferase
VTTRTLALPSGASRAAGLARALKLAAVCFELSKPRMVTMILVTTLAGFYMGSGAVPGYGTLLATLLGTGLAAAGALALNQVMERDTDARMDRTMRRPLPDGRISPRDAAVFGVTVTAAGLVFLALAVNLLSAAVTAATVGSYLLAYTPMKRRTALCTVVGAIPGALPPVTGWAAATGDLGAGAAVLFGIMFFWQIPHSLAIAWLYREDYAKGGTKLLPTVDPGGRSTARQIVINAIALLGAGLLPAVIGLAGSIYFLTALVMGAWMLADSLRAAIETTNPAARRLLRTSLVYVPVVLIVMALDRLPFY